MHISEFIKGGVAAAADSEYWARVFIDNCADYGCDIDSAILHNAVSVVLKDCGVINFEAALHTGEILFTTPKITGPASRHVASISFKDLTRHHTNAPAEEFPAHADACTLAHRMD